jgi:hypothetical protein
MKDERMPSAHRDIEVAQDLNYQRMSWRIQRIAWIVLALVVLAALAGLAGTGPLSRAERTAPDGSLRLEYERFTRMYAPSRLRVHFDARAVRAGEVRIWIARRYLEQAKLEQVVPQPARVEVEDERLTYVFAAGDGAAGAVTFYMQLQSFGRISGRVGSGPAALEYRQLVYP